MVLPLLAIGLLIGADAVLGYRLGIDRAKRRGSREALAAFEQGALGDAFRHWAVVTGLGLVSGAVIGERAGPGGLHGFLTVAVASVGISLPMLYVAGGIYTRKAAELMRG